MLALLDLPDELLLHVALQCDDVADVLRFARTCTALHALITHTDHLWQQLLHAHYGSAHVCDAHASPCDHRALYRTHCERLTWAWPTSSRGHLSHVDGDEATVVRTPGAGSFAASAAYCEPPLPRTGLSCVCVLVSGIAKNIGLIAYDGELDGGWDADSESHDVLRMHVFLSGAQPLFMYSPPGVCSLRHQPVAAHQPAGWCAGAPHYAESGRRAYMAVDAHRGRMYLALGTPARWLLAFDDARLARRDSVRACVLLWESRWDVPCVPIERVRVTDEIRAALRALDAEYEAARRAPANE